MPKYEVGVVTAHPIHFMWLQILTIWRTWMHCRKANRRSDKWYGVYEIGTERIVVNCGVGGDAQDRAKLFIEASSVEGPGTKKPEGN